MYKNLFNYLYLKTTSIKSSDFIIGFGHFDLKIPKQCSELYLKRFAPQIIFTGGFGSGSADFKIPEAQTFANHLKKTSEDIPKSIILIEDQSTNTSENINLVYNNFLVHNPDIERIIIVANAYRQRRVYLTCIQHLPEIEFINAPPNTSYEEEICLFEEKGENLPKQLIGEMDRLLLYSKKGYIAEPNIPEDIYQTYLQLKRKK